MQDNQTDNPMSLSQFLRESYLNETQHRHQRPSSDSAHPVLYGTLKGKVEDDPQFPDLSAFLSQEELNKSVDLAQRSFGHEQQQDRLDTLYPVQIISAAQDNIEVLPEKQVLQTENKIRNVRTPREPAPKSAKNTSYGTEIQSKKEFLNKAADFIEELSSLFKANSSKRIRPKACKAHRNRHQGKHPYDATSFIHDPEESDRTVLNSETLDFHSDSQASEQVYNTETEGAEPVFEIKCETSVSEEPELSEPVYEPPRFIQKLKSREVPAGSKVQLDCIVRGFPAPEVRWFCEGKELENSPDIQIINDSDRHSLIITEAFEEDTGRYSCFASNFCGTDSTSAEIYIEGATSSDSDGEQHFEAQVNKRAPRPAVTSFPEVPTASPNAEESLISQSFNHSALPETFSPPLEPPTVSTPQEPLTFSPPPEPPTFSPPPEPPTFSPPPEPPTFSPPPEPPAFSTPPEPPAFSSPPESQTSMPAADGVESQPSPVICSSTPVEEVSPELPSPFHQMIPTVPSVHSVDTLAAPDLIRDTSDFSVNPSFTENHIFNGYPQGLDGRLIMAAPVFTKSLQDLTASEGQLVVLECRVKGVPSPRVDWYREGMLIEDSPDFRILQKKNICTLVIAEVFTEDSGMFTCTASNKYGTVSSVALLTVKGNEENNNNKHILSSSTADPCEHKSLEPEPFTTPSKYPLTSCLKSTSKKSLEKQKEPQSGSRVGLRVTFKLPEDEEKSNSIKDPPPVLAKPKLNPLQLQFLQKQVLLEQQQDSVPQNLEFSQPNQEHPVQDNTLYTHPHPPPPSPLTQTHPPLINTVPVPQINPPVFPFTTSVPALLLTDHIPLDEESLPSTVFFNKSPTAVTLTPQPNLPLNPQFNPVPIHFAPLSTQIPQMISGPAPLMPQLNMETIQPTPPHRLAPVSPLSTVPPDSHLNVISTTPLPPLTTTLSTTVSNTSPPQLNVVSTMQLHQSNSGVMVNMNTMPPVYSSPTVPLSITPTAPLNITSTAPLYSTSTVPLNITPTAPLNITPPAPLNISPTNPQNITPTAPLNITPTAPLNITPTVPLNITPIAPLNITPTAPLNLTPTVPLNLTSTAPLNLTSTAPLNLPPTAPLNLPPTALLNLTPTAPLNFTPTAPLNFTPTAPLNIIPTAPIKISPTAPLNITPTGQLTSTSTAPLNITPTAPRNNPTAQLNSTSTAQQNVTPTAPLNITPTAPLNVTPTALLNTTPTAPMKIPPIAPLNITPTTQVKSVPITLKDTAVDTTRSMLLMNSPETHSISVNQYNMEQTLVQSSNSHNSTNSLLSITSTALLQNTPASVLNVPPASINQTLSITSVSSNSSVQTFSYTRPKEFIAAQALLPIRSPSPPPSPAPPKFPSTTRDHVSSSNHITPSTQVFPTRLLESPNSPLYVASPPLVPPARVHPVFVLRSQSPSQASSPTSSGSTSSPIQDPVAFLSSVLPSLPTGPPTNAMGLPMRAPPRPQTALKKSHRTSWSRSEEEIYDSRESLIQSIEKKLQNNNEIFRYGQQKLDFGWEASTSLGPNIPTATIINYDEEYKVSNFEQRLMSEIEFRLERTPVEESDEEIQHDEIPTGRCIAPLFEKKLKNFKAVEGIPVTFTCKLVGIPVPKVYWFKDGKQILKRNIHCKRIREGDGTCSLFINAVTNDDDGNYTVMAANPQGRISCSGHLIVQSGPMRNRSVVQSQRVRTRVKQVEEGEPSQERFFRPHFLQAPGDMVSHEGRLCRLDCKVSGLPHPEIMWLLNGKPIRADLTHRMLVRENGVHSLVIDPLSKDDAGTYTCIASNKAGQSSICLILNVVEKEMKQAPYFVEKLQNTGITEGTPVRLECRVVGMPPPVFFWKKDNETLSEMTDRFSLHQDTTGYGCLLIQPTRKEDAGWYTVSAKNDSGIISCTARLDIYAQWHQQVHPPIRKPSLTGSHFATLTGDVNSKPVVFTTAQEESTQESEEL